MGKYRVCLAVLLASSAGGASAQEAQTPIGPAELRDFTLPGTPAPSQPEPTPTPSPSPAEAETPAEQPAPIVTPPPARAEPRATTPPPERRPQVQPAPETTQEPPAAETATEPMPEPEIEPLPAPVQTPVEAPAPAATVEAAPEPGGTPWLWLLLAGLVAVAGLALWKSGVLRGLAERRPVRRREEPEELLLTAADLARPVDRPAAEPAAVAAAPKPAPSADEAPRPRIEIVFKPAKAEATDAGTSVHYELIVKNLGTAPARDVKVEVRMFNAGPDQDKEIGAFFAAPLQEKLVTRPFEIPSRSQAKLSRVVSMTKEEVRVITIQGRRLFIPMVAFNVVYDRGDGQTGQTSRCFVVGREKETPSEKMGAFRLDLGPRIYRSVGQRQTKLAHIA
jgi:hypothetical protein